MGKKGWVQEKHIERLIDRYEEMLKAKDTEIARLQAALEKVQDRFLAFAPEAAETYASLRAAAADRDGKSPRADGPRIDSLEDHAEQEDRAQQAQFDQEEKDAIRRSEGNLARAEGRLRAVTTREPEI